MPEITPFFDVARTPLYTELDGERISVDREALINTATGGVLGTVGRNYKLVENQEVDTIFAEAFQALPVEFTKDHLNGATNRWQRDIILGGDEFTKVIGSDDILKTKVSIWNGYDGRTSVGFALSAWRQVCSNGMMGWRKAFGSTYAHVTHGIVDSIRREFESSFANFTDNFQIWDEWNRTGMSQEQFIRFVQGLVKTGEKDNTGYLSEKQAEAITGMYEPIMNQFGENETKWGAYNVLTAIATHHTKARNGSNIFSQGYKRMERVAQDFFSYDPTDELFTI